MRVAVLSHVRLYRESIGEALAARPDVTVVGDSCPDASGVTRIRRLWPDIALLDVAPAGSVAALRDLITGLAGIRSVAIGVLTTEEQVLACLEAGVAAYVSRDDDLSRLVETMREVAGGGAVFSPAATGGVFRRLAALADERRSARPAPPLTEREQEIAGLLAEGLSNAEIARRLFIEVSTVKNHVHNILGKLQLAGRAGVAA